MLLTPIIQILAYTTFKTLSLLSNTESVRSVNTHSYTLRSLDWYTPPLGKHKLIHSSTFRREHQHVHDTQRRTYTHVQSRVVTESGVRGVPVKGELPQCSDQPWQAHEWAFIPACNISEEKGWDYKNYISHDALQRPTSAFTSTHCMCG